jgi:hypothetical protein
VGSGHCESVGDLVSVFDRVLTDHLRIWKRRPDARVEFPDVGETRPHARVTVQEGVLAIEIEITVPPGGNVKQAMASWRIRTLVFIGRTLRYAGSDGCMETPGFGSGLGGIGGLEGSLPKQWHAKPRRARSGQEQRAGRWSF